MRRDIRLEQVLAYPREVVWRALTEPSVFGSWFMENDFEPELGHQFTFHMKPQRGWDGVTHCQVIELEPLRRVAYTYRGQASGEKPLACAGIDSRAADAAAKGIFAELDTVLRFTLSPKQLSDGTEGTRLTLEHTGFKGFKMIIVSFIMGSGWKKVLRRLSATLESTKGDPIPAPGERPEQPIAAQL
jgi:uncharacterized protein YndB with AHSA1/START domain